MAKVERFTAAGEIMVFYGFMCPACGERHAVCTARSNDAAAYTFNGSLDQPTFYPAILVPGADGDPTAICHSYVTDGRIRFLTDCTHALAGRELELPDLAPIDPG